MNDNSKIKQLQDQLHRRARQLYQKVKPYIPETPEEGKTAAYTLVGVGSAVALGLVGYGLYSATSGASASSRAALTNCETKYNQEVNLWNEYNQKFLQENIANNVPFSPEQQAYLNNIVKQENLIAQTCFKDNWIAASASTISSAFAIGILLYLGARGLAYITKKGYLKPPKNGNGGNASTPAGASARAQLGIIDYERTAGIISPSWVSSGITTVSSIVASAAIQVQDFAAEMVALDFIDAAVAADMVATEAVAIDDAEVLVLAALV